MARRSVTKGYAPRILIYSQDGFGLGHLRRNLNICIQIKKRQPKASCLIIADSPVAPFFPLPSNCDFIKIPTIVKVDTGIWRPDRLPMSERELLAIRSDIIRNVATSFQPDIFLVDHMPHGALGELAEPLEILKKYSPHTKVILGIRDILGAPEVIRRQWNNEGAFAAIAAFYDAVFIYGCTEVFDVITQYGFPSALAEKAQYCGYVCREDAEIAPPPKGQPQPVAENPGKFILVTGGGGADAAFFMDQFIDAARLLHPDLRFHALITTGPFMHKDQRTHLRQKTHNLPIAVSWSGDDSIRYLRRADLVVSMAGYNTISEILHFRKSAIVVPRAGPSAEQSIRSRLMSERGLFSTIHPTHLAADNFAEMIWQKLGNGNGMNEAMLPNLNGASRVAAQVLATT
ncbi:MAG: glycosyltransferase [candidate division KSB1 bacterium]|nr:glycosyltransferase [candidate division KSB1 bacterium]MDZ7369243.1 glycosyltransferase [candidate division KSB1 bacterium]MDZ7407223.1 glycosyltransferase [candidate division KSB1 bacterium]